MIALNVFKCERSQYLSQKVTVYFINVFRRMYFHTLLLILYVYTDVPCLILKLCKDPINSTLERRH